MRAKEPKNARTWEDPYLQGLVQELNRLKERVSKLEAAIEDDPIMGTDLVIDGDAELEHIFGDSV